MNPRCISTDFARHALLLLAAVLVFTTPAVAYNSLFSDEQLVQEIALPALPVEARNTLHLIKQGGPFPYARDGVVFGNYEKQLPRQQRGYYHEYTVKTPGVRSRSRGARRIVCGQPAECYYSNDHYQTFKRIRE